MPRWLLLVLLVFPVTGSASADVVPQKKWLQVQSPNFTVMGEVGARDLRRVAERMEQLHAVLGMLTTATGVETSDVTVVVFRDRRAFQPFQPLYDGKRVAVAGYLLPGPMTYIGVLAEPDVDYSSVVYHEYIHLAAGRTLGELPPWMGEGLAEFYSTFESINGGKAARLGSVPMHHVERLQHEFIPLTTLTAVGHDSPYYNEKNKSSAFYAESWALIHFLQIGKERKYAPKLRGFFGAILDGVSFDRACVEQLGTTPQALEAELRLYLGSPVFYRVNVPLPEIVERLERLQPAPVDEGAAHAVLAQLLLAQRQIEDARAHLDHAVSVDTQQPLALARLADLAAAANKHDDAVALARRAGEAPNPSYISAFYRAAALEQAVGHAAVDQAAVVAAWQQVVTLNPNFAEGLVRLAQARADGREGLDQARQSQQRAIALVPAREDYKLGLARILIMLGETKAARDMLGSLVARGSTPAIKTTARRYLAVAAQAELARSAGGDAPVPERPPEVTIVPDEPPRADEPAPGTPATASPPAMTPPSTANLERLLLRHVLDGEVRIFGPLTAIECSTGGTVLVIQAPSGVVRVRGGTLDTVDFVSYRSDIAGGINCGPQKQSPHVLVTYRPEREGDTAGEVIIVEVVPAGYKPPAG